MIRFEIVVLVPVPVIDPGLIVQIPVEGSPFRITLPVGAVHEDGWVITPILGEAGVPGGEIIITSVEGSEIQPASLVMLKLYVPGTRFVMVMVVPVPFIAPGLIVHVPVAGRPLNTMLPVGTAHEAG